ncbi:universal stress protein [Deferrisoma camini]|uniref:universal stress protein n=1 Tax=Deferrisoma camini TaxID=1035120 RepID=UPI00046D53FB|nr:universal stress protein [Deferrisoma camini]
MLPTVRTILCAVDLEAGTDTVFRQAAGLAESFGARLVVVHAVRPLGPSAKALLSIHLSAEQMGEIRQRLRNQAAAQIRAHMDRVCREETKRQPEGDSDWVALVVEGQPAEVVLEEAHSCGADLIVMGSHGHTAVGEMVLGTTAHKVVLRSPVPVLLVPVSKKGGGEWVG